MPADTRHMPIKDLGKVVPDFADRVLGLDAESVHVVEPEKAVGVVVCV